MSKVRRVHHSLKEVRSEGWARLFHFQDADRETKRSNTSVLQGFVTKVCARQWDKLAHPAPVLC